jgi:probable HAF family extracellular repeat protein
MKALCRIVLLLVMPAVLTSLTFGQRYSLRAIATLGTSASAAFDINNQLQIVGGAPVTPGGVDRAFLWTRTTRATDLGAPGFFSEAFAVNDTGQVVGCAIFPGGGFAHAFLWTQANGMEDLGTLPGGTFSCAQAINSTGQVTGFAKTSSGSAHAFIWTQANGMQDLGAFAGNSFAFGINDKGQVVGVSDNAVGGGTSAVVWMPALGMRKLLSPVGAANAEAHAINNLGQIVGQVTYNNAHGGATHAALWPHLLKGGLKDLGALPGGTQSAADAINANGVVVGFSTISPAPSLRGFVWTAAGGMHDLNALVVPANSRWLISEGRGINGVGKIVVNAFDTSKGTLRAVLLSPQATTTAKTH